MCKFFSLYFQYAIFYFISAIKHINVRLEIPLSSCRHTSPLPKWYSMVKNMHNDKTKKTSILSRNISDVVRIFLTQNILIRTIKGECKIIFEDESQLTICTNCFSFIERGQSIEVVTHSEYDNSEIQILELNDSVLKHIVNHTSLLLVGKDKTVNNKMFYSKEIQDSTHFIFNELFSVREVFFSKEIAIIFLLSFFFSEQGFIKSLERTANISYRERVYSIIYNNLQTGCDLNKAAELFGISSSTLKRKLQMEKTTFTEILLDVRMNHALSLLRNTSLSISQVSYKSGFYSASNFCSKFKRYFGLSPKQVSKKLTNNIKLEVLKF